MTVFLLAAEVYSGLMPSMDSSEVRSKNPLLDVGMLSIVGVPLFWLADGAGVTDGNAGAGEALVWPEADPLLLLLLELLALLLLFLALMLFCMSLRSCSVMPRSVINWAMLTFWKLEEPPLPSATICP